MTKTHKIIQYLLPLLKVDGLTRAEIQHKLRIDNRSTTRYLTEIETLGYRLLKSGKKNIRYRIQSNDTPIIHDEDIKLLKKVKVQFEKDGNLPVSDSIKCLIQRLSSIKTDNEAEAIAETLKGNDLFLLSPVPNGDKTINPALVKALYSAAKNHSVVRIDYKPPQSDESESFNFHPVGLSMRNGKLYCCGERDNGKIYSLPIVRFKRITTTGKSFEKITNSIFDIYQHSFGSFLHKKPEKVVIEIKSKWMEEYLKEVYIHHTAKIVSKRGKTYLTMEVGVDEELLGWVRSWGEKMICRHNKI